VCVCVCVCVWYLGYDFQVFCDTLLIGIYGASYKNVN